jgi:hypothetical protein
MDDMDAINNEISKLTEQRDELLAALKVAVEVMRDNGIDESMAGEFEVFTDAISKAEGRQGPCQPTVE